MHAVQPVTHMLTSENTASHRVLKIVNRSRAPQRKPQAPELMWIKNLAKQNLPITCSNLHWLQFARQSKLGFRDLLSRMANSKHTEAGCNFVLQLEMIGLRLDTQLVVSLC